MYDDFLMNQNQINMLDTHRVYSNLVSKNNPNRTVRPDILIAKDFD